MKSQRWWVAVLMVEGLNTIENAQNTCQNCNLSKGAKTTEEFLNEGS